jgi:hypothetical protein
MPQMDQTTFFSIFETLIFVFILGYTLLSTYFLLPLINTMKIKYELKTRLFFINFLVIKNLKGLNSFKFLKVIKIHFPYLKNKKYGRR